MKIEKGNFTFITTSIEGVYNIEPKKICFLYPKQNKEANILLIEGIKNRRLTKKAVEELIDDGADLSLRDREGCTALMYAILNRDLEIVYLLIEKGSDVNARDKNCCTALMLAAENGNFKIVEFLVKKGANVNVRDKKGHIALMLAADRGHLDIVEFLMNHGKNI